MFFSSDAATNPSKKVATLGNASTMTKPRVFGKFTPSLDAHLLITITTPYAPAGPCLRGITPIYKPFRQFGRRITLLTGLTITMVIKHLSKSWEPHPPSGGFLPNNLITFGTGRFFDLIIFFEVGKKYPPKNIPLNGGEIQW